MAVFAKVKIGDLLISKTITPTSNPKVTIMKRITYKVLEKNTTLKSFKVENTRTKEITTLTNYKRLEHESF